MDVYDIGRNYFEYYSDDSHYKRNATLSEIEELMKIIGVSQGDYSSMEDISVIVNYPAINTMQVSGDKCSVVATPERYGSNNYLASGGISLFMDESGVIRIGDKNGEAATLEDDPMSDQ
jgi:hypothetical protein